MDFDEEIERQRLELDPQEQPVFCCCDDCGCEIYEGEEYFNTESGFLCENCFDEYIANIRADCARIAGED